MPKRRAPARTANGRRKAAAPAKAPALGARLEDAPQESWERILTEEMNANQSRSNVSLRWVEVQCPYCGEDFEVRVDPSEEGQSMVQDCQVCCKAILLAVDSEDGDVAVSASRA